MKEYDGIESYKAGTLRCFKFYFEIYYVMVESSSFKPQATINTLYESEDESFSTDTSLYSYYSSDDFIQKRTKATPEKSSCKKKISPVSIVTGGE